MVLQGECHFQRLPERGPWFESDSSLVFCPFPLPVCEFNMVIAGALRHHEDNFGLLRCTSILEPRYKPNNWTNICRTAGNIDKHCIFNASFWVMGSFAVRTSSYRLSTGFGSSGCVSCIRGCSAQQLLWVVASCWWISLFQFVLHYFWQKNNHGINQGYCYTPGFVSS